MYVCSHCNRKLLEVINMVNENVEISYERCPEHPNGSVSLINETVIIVVQEEETP